MLPLKFGLLITSFGKKNIFLVASFHYLGMFCVYLHLLAFYKLALHALIAGIFSDIPHAPQHLREIVGRKYEHQFVLRVSVSVEIHHGTTVTLFAHFQFRLQRIQLRFQFSYLAVKSADIC